MTAWRRWLGVQSEKLAERHLRQCGYHILDKNVRLAHGELDIVALDGETLVFCEVRARTGTLSGQPGESINYKKQHKLLILADAYLQGHANLANSVCRFDAVLVQKLGPKWHIDVIKDAFRPGW